MSNNYAYGGYINQRAFVENSSLEGFGDIDLKTVFILDYIKDFTHSRKCERLKEQPEYFWVSPQLILDQLPLLRITSTRQIITHIDKLVLANILERHKDNQKFRRTYLKFGVNYDKLIIFEYNQDSLVAKTNNYAYGENINQRAFVENSSLDGFCDIDLKTVFILEFIKNFANSRKCERLKEQPEYFWVSPQLILKQLPLLRITSARRIITHIEKLVLANILERHKDNQKLHRTYFKFGINYDKLITFEYNKESLVAKTNNETMKKTSISTMKKTSISTMKKTSIYNNTIDIREQLDKKSSFPRKLGEGAFFSESNINFADPLIDCKKQKAEGLINDDFKKERLNNIKKMFLTGSDFVETGSKLYHITEAKIEEELNKFLKSIDKKNTCWDDFSKLRQRAVAYMSKYLILY